MLIQDYNETIPWHFQHDTAYVATSDESRVRSLVTIAGLVCKTLQTTNVPDITLQYHKQEPKNKDDGSEAYCRYTVTPNGKGTTFVPHSLTDEQLASSVLKRGIAGALFKGKFEKLPTSNGAIIFEVEPITDPPAHVRAVRPKFWFVGTLRMKHGIMYKLV